ncbi:FMN-dependent NADH-azoreductase [Inquilinus sp.]|jgi:FMN-dependent NADH-azoreductase|uniref:FMN-dependent NADH-azoreductase n=1 Tax=Inquilinus sp. TaxID=1932117 RepID=UPI003784C61F
MNILHIDCSTRPMSQSRQLSAGLVAALLRARPDGGVVRRDLGREPVPHTDPAFSQAVTSRAALAAGIANGAVSASEALIVEVEAADILVIGTPMHNFGVPSVLKAWIDQIVRVGRTFTPVPTGKVGLLKDRPVFVCIASGGYFSGDLGNQPDFLTPYLTAVLGCVGLTDIRYLPIQGTAFRDEAEVAAAREALLDGLDASTLAA